MAFFGVDGRLNQASDSFQRSIPAASKPDTTLDGLLPKFAEPDIWSELCGLPETAMALEIALPHPVTGDAMFAHAFRAGAGFGVILEIATEGRAAADSPETDELLHWASRDSLTGLQNRRLFGERLGQLLASPSTSTMGVALLQIDLDDFKAVNDTLGHGAGDTLLQLVARRIEASLDNNAIGFRYAGDEFAVIQFSGNQPRDAERLAELLISRLKAPFEINDIPIFIGASIGIAFGTEHGITTEQLMRAADIALYVAKSEGRGRARIFNNAMLAFLERRENLRRDLRKALHRGELFVEYQPLVRLPFSIVGFEALLRWRHPEAGIIAPGSFISIAEADGLMDEIGQWVLERACTDALDWPPSIRITVNLSPAQFRSGFLIDNVCRAIDRIGIQPDRLEFEITETVLLEQTIQNLDILHTLSLLGIGVSLDDFGTSYSSLGYLKDFNFNSLKIDKYFIRDLEINKKSQTIVRSILNLAHGLGMSVTAEGVETEAQLRWLAKEGCDRQQGFLIGPPLSSHDTIRFIEKIARDPPIAS